MENRGCPWRKSCPEEVRCRQLRAMYGPPLRLIRTTGPLGFIIRDDARAGNSFLVRLGSRHSCSCQQNTRDLCIHICWTLLRLFRLKPTDPLSFQLGLVARELATLLRGAPQNYDRLPPLPRSDIPEIHISETWNNISTETTNLKSQRKVTPRRVTSNDKCPICLEGLLESHMPVTFCRYSCGNPVHLSCMARSLKHNKASGNDAVFESQEVKCPMCRGVFNSRSELNMELGNAPRCNEEFVQLRRRESRPACARRQRLLNHRLPRAPISSESNPEVSAVEDTIARLLQSAVHHLHHADTLPHVDDDSMSTCSSHSSHDTTELIQPVATPVLVRALPSWRVPPRHRLLVPGRQCCLCLTAYQTGDMVSGLPCGHEFHTACLRPWLLRSTELQQRASHGCRCPLDGSNLIPWLTEKLLNMQKTLPSCVNPSLRKTKDIPTFEIASLKIIPKNRLFTRQLSRNSNTSCSSQPALLPRAHSTRRPATREVRASCPQSTAASVHQLTMTLEVPTDEASEAGSRPRTPVLPSRRHLGWSPRSSAKSSSSTLLSLPWLAATAATSKLPTTNNFLHCQGMQVALVQKQSISSKTQIN